MKKRESVSDIFKNFSIKTFLIDNIFFVIGSILYASGVLFFAKPNQIAQSGITGLAIIINYLLPNLSIGLLSFVLNVPLIILAWFIIGKRFTVKTLWVTAVLSGTIGIIENLVGKNILPVYNGNPIIAALFCGAMCGAGIALILIRGATSGGTDVLGRLLKKLIPHMSIGRMIMFCDAAVVITAAIVFRNVDSAMYAVILIFVSSQVMDYILYGAGNGKMLYIFSKKGEEIGKAITSRSRRGATVFEGKGMYTGDNQELVICVARSNEIPKIRKWVKELDPNSFVVLTEANEILGKGFAPPAVDD